MNYWNLIRFPIKSRKYFISTKNLHFDFRTLHLRIKKAKEIYSPLISFSLLYIVPSRFILRVVHGILKLTNFHWTVAKKSNSD